jgi:hypothetical protein
MWARSYGRASGAATRWLTFPAYRYPPMQIFVLAVVLTMWDWSTAGTVTAATTVAAVG